MPLFRGVVAINAGAKARRPVIVVPDADRQGHSGWLAPRPIVCGVDGSPQSLAALRVASALAHAFQTVLTVATLGDRDRPRCACERSPERFAGLRSTARNASRTRGARGGAR